MPQLAEEDAPSLTHSLRYWLPRLDLLWCVDSWNIWVPVALLQSIMTGWVGQHRPLANPLSNMHTALPPSSSANHQAANVWEVPV